MGYAARSADTGTHMEYPLDTGELSELSDLELKNEISRLTEREREISFQRRYLHGQIEAAKAELIRRLRSHVEGELSVGDLDELSRILDGWSRDAADR